MSGLVVCLGEPVQCTAWAGQCALYILIMMFEKVLIILVLLIPQWKKVSISKFSEFSKSTVFHYQVLRCLCQFVSLYFPSILNMN